MGIPLVERSVVAHSCFWNTAYCTEFPMRVTYYVHFTEFVCYRIVRKSLQLTWFNVPNPLFSQNHSFVYE